jgi:hypothetical protein
MVDRIFEMVELFLVNLGMQLGRLSEQQKRMVSLFLASLLVAAVVTRVLQGLVAR